MEQIGRYSVVKELGHGGFGEVWLAKDDFIDREVAIKIFKPRDSNLVSAATSSNTDALGVLQERFLNEARILGSLAHVANVISVLDYGQDDEGNPYYVMPYLPLSLVDLIGKDAFSRGAREDTAADLLPRQLELNSAIEFLEQIAAGMAEVHRAGLVHRDLKPANILINDRQQVNICDFGIAKVPDAEFSQTGVGMGSRNYMSPEQRESAKHVEPSSDIYSIGVIAYRMITGSLPTGRFSDPKVYQPLLSQAINDIVLKALSFEPEERFKDGAELLSEIRRAERESSQGAAAPAGEETGTWVSAGEATLRDELKPLRDRIESLFLSEGEITEDEHHTLETLAAIAGLGVLELDQLVDEISNGSDPKISKVRNFIGVVERRLEGGPLSDRNRESLYVGGEAVGWTREQVDQLIARKTGTELKPPASSDKAETPLSDKKVEASTTQPWSSKPKRDLGAAARAGVAKAKSKRGETEDAADAGKSDPAVDKPKSNEPATQPWSSKPKRDLGAAARAGVARARSERGEAVDEDLAKSSDENSSPVQDNGGANAPATQPWSSGPKRDLGAAARAGVAKAESQRKDAGVEESSDLAEEPLPEISLGQQFAYLLGKPVEDPLALIVVRRLWIRVLICVVAVVGIYLHSHETGSFNWQFAVFWLMGGAAAGILNQYRQMSMLFASLWVVFFIVVTLAIQGKSFGSNWNPPETWGYQNDGFEGLFYLLVLFGLYFSARSLMLANKGVSILLAVLLILGVFSFENQFSALSGALSILS